MNLGKLSADAKIALAIQLLRDSIAERADAIALRDYWTRGVRTASSDGSYLRLNPAWAREVKRLVDETASGVVDTLHEIVAQETAERQRDRNAALDSIAEAVASGDTRSARRIAVKALEDLNLRKPEYAARDLITTLEKGRWARR
jgi:hypothetical protein